MVIRSKFKLISITTTYWNQNCRVYKFQAEYDQSIAEDQRFYKATPTATLEITVDNENVVNEWKLGNYYYFDASPVPEVVRP